MSLTQGGAVGSGVGKMRDRVTLQVPVRSRSSSGQTLISWLAVGDIFARVRALSGNELYAARQVRPDVAYEVSVRYRPDISADCRLIWQGRTLNVSACVVGDKSHGGLILHCNEVANNTFYAIGGTVVYAGVAVASGSVVVTRIDVAGSVGVTFAVDQFGAFVASLLPPGVYSVVASSVGHASGAAVQIDVTKSSVSGVVATVV